MVNRDPKTGRIVGRLTPEQVKEIKWYIREARRGRQRLPWGFPKRLADLFGVTERTIEAIRRRERHRHISLYSGRKRKK